MTSPKNESVLFEPDSNDEWLSEFVDFGPEDSPFFESLADLSENVHYPSLPTLFDNSTNASGVQPSAAGPDWPHESQNDQEPATVHLPQLNLQVVDETYQMQLGLRAGSQQPPEYHDPHQQPREDSPEQQQRILRALAPQTRRSGTNLQHPSGDQTPGNAKIAKRKTKTYPEEDITCHRCNTKTETPGELR